MKKIIVVLLMLNLSFSFAQNVSWVKTLGGTEYEDLATSVAVDDNGSVYLAGNFKGTCNFNDGSNFTSYGGTDMFLSKYSTDGVCQWTKRFGGTAVGAGSYTDNLYDIAVDTAGNILVVGVFTDNCDFGDTTFTMTGQLWNSFIAKYDPSGNLLWAKKLGSTALSIEAVAVDQSTNDFYITGDLNGNLTFGAVSLTLSEYTDVFIIKCDANGNGIWGRKGTGNQEFGNELTCDEQGNVYVIGDIWGSTLSFDGTSISTNAGSNDLFIVKYNSSGVLQWLKGFGGTNDVDYGLAIHYSNNQLFATGKVQGLGTFGTLTFDAIDQGCFLMGLDLNGSVNWLTGATTGTWGIDVGTDQNGNLFWYGTVFGSSTINGQAFTGEINGDFFVARYNSSGSLISHFVDGGANQQGSNSGRNISMAVDKDGFIYVTGQYYLSANFMGNSFTSNGFFDMYLVKYDFLEQAGLQNIGNENTSIYPNPATEGFIIQGLRTPTDLTLFDSQHKRIQMIKSYTEGQFISTEYLSPGIYFIQIADQSRTLKFLKQ